MGWQQQRFDNARGKLMSEDEREAFIREHGELVRSVLDRVLDEKAIKLVEGYGKALVSALGNGEPDPSECRLMTSKEAAELVAVPVSTIKRLKALGLEKEKGSVWGTCPEASTRSPFRICHPESESRKNCCMPPKEIRQ